MKLFITNKEEFTNYFDDPNNTYYLDSKTVHRDAFNQLYKAINIDNVIPLLLSVIINDDGDVALLDFHTFQNGVYFYTFSGSTD